MSGDPYWLPGTAAVCSATLVAIVGGLLASRVVAATIDAATEARRLADLTMLLRTKRDERDRAEKAVRDAEAKRWVASVLAKIAAAHGNIDLETMLRMAPSAQSSSDLMAEFNYVCQVMREGFGAIDLMIEEDQLDLLPHSWDSVRGRLGSHNMYDDRIRAQAYAQRYTEGRRAHEPSSEPLQPFSALSDAVDVAMSTLPEPLDSLSANWHRLEPSVGELEAQVAAAKTHASPGAVVALRNSYIELGAAALVGVLFPLTELSMAPSKINWLMRLLLVLSVVASLLLVFMALTGRPKSKKHAHARNGEGA